jgi:hypothetical protein
MSMYSSLIFEVDDIADVKMKEVIDRVDFDILFNTRCELNEINSHAFHAKLMLNLINASFLALFSICRNTLLFTFISLNQFLSFICFLNVFFNDSNISTFNDCK